MVAVVFALAVANLGLGFALALALDRFPAWSTWSFNGDYRLGSPIGGVAIEHDAGSSALSPHDEWSQKLWDAEVDPKSTIERLLWIVKLETGWRRERLIELDRAFFDMHSPQPIDAEFKQELALLHELLESWITQADAEKEHAGLIAESLEELLLDQAFQLHSCIEALGETDHEHVVRPFATAMNGVNVLRDRADALLSQLLSSEDRLHTVADHYRLFGERDTLTRLGLAALFGKWWSDDPDHVRLVSLVMLDLDRFEPFTAQIGAARGDVALARFGDMLHDLVRKDRGFDRVARFSGQRFVVFMGDTSAKNAAKGAERIRQSIEATSFKLGEDASEVTASLAVIEVGKNERPGDFIPRLEATLEASKRAGRNCAHLDSGAGPEPIRLPQYQVSVRVIELDDEVG